MIYANIQQYAKEMKIRWVDAKKMSLSGELIQTSYINKGNKKKNLYIDPKKMIQKLVELKHMACPGESSCNKEG